MLYIILALSLITTALTQFLLGLYTAWWNIPVFIGLFCAEFIVWSAIIFGIMFLWSLTVNKSKERNHVSNFYRWLFVESIRMSLLFLNVRVHIEGADKIPKDQRYLFVANHLSNYDPMSVLGTLHKEKIVFISKPENFNIPLVGALMYKTGFMAIDRDHVRNAIVTINKAADYIKSGESNVFIFPEGTRNRTDTPLLEFRNGAFKIATKAGCPIVVAAISETEKVKHNIPKRSDVYIKIVEVIPAEQVKAMRTADISDDVWHKIYANITHGTKTPENANPVSKKEEKASNETKDGVKDTDSNTDKTEEQW